jgi:hypothetical protein
MEDLCAGMESERGMAAKPDGSAARAGRAAPGTPPPDNVRFFKLESL